MNTILINKKKKELKLTNEDISKFTGISLSTISKICSGHLRNTSDDKLLKLANVLNCNLEDIKNDNAEISYTIEDKIRKLIIDKYGSISKFAEKVNINPTTIITILKNGIETGSFGRVYKICEELEININTLLNMDSNKSLEDIHLNTSEENLILSFRELNNLGKNKVIEYTKDMLKINKYKEVKTFKNSNTLEFINNNRNFNNEIITRRAHNDYQDDDKEQNLMNEDFEMMKQWKKEHNK